MTLKRFSEVETSGLRFEMDYPNLQGWDAYDVNGDDIGEVQDMVVNTDTGTVRHAIIGRGWLASLMGERQVIVPFNRITVNPSERTVRLDISREELARFPDWQDVSEAGLSDRLADWWERMRRAA